jgi:hypothetical protein
LTDAATQDRGENLYEYDFSAAEGHHLIDLSAGDTSGHGPGVEGVVAMSNDGSHVYFVAEGVLTPTSNGQGQLPRADAENLYVYERDGAYPAGHTAFITDLSSADATEWKNPENPANVTPEGRYLLFTSHSDLTPDDDSAAGAAQVFRYDADQTAQEISETVPALVRISIGNDGFNDDGNGFAPTPCNEGLCSLDARIASNLTTDQLNHRDPSMSNNGQYVFFQSPVGLTPQALDDVRVGEHVDPQVPEYAQNVYEYHEGHVHLISDGHDVSVNKGDSSECTENATSISSVCLLGTDASGADVFFTTADQLVSQDTDTELDVYDARICTSGEPCVQVPPPLAPCNEEACHGIPPAVPALLTPGSATFNGQGNIPPAASGATPRALTRAQKLAAALRTCRKDKQKRARSSCEKQAHQKYGPIKSKKNPHTSKKKGNR